MPTLISFKSIIGLFCLAFLLSCKKDQEVVVPKETDVFNGEVVKPFTWLALGDSYTIGQGVKEQERFPAQAVKLLDERNIFVVEGEAYDNNGYPAYYQLNFGRPASVSGFIQENKSLWKPFFEKNMSKMNMKVWGVARRLTFPTLETSQSTVVSWDAFGSLEDLMKYRIGIDLPGYSEVIEKSKMTTYMPDGFTYAPIFKVLKATTPKK